MKEAEFYDKINKSLESASLGHVAEMGKNESALEFVERLLKENKIC